MLGFNFLIPIFTKRENIVSADDYDWVIDGDTVYVNNSQVFASASPHTIVGGGDVVFEFESKEYSGDVDFVWGFNQTHYKPTSIWLWKNYSHPQYSWGYMEDWGCKTLYNVSNYTSLGIENYGLYDVCLGTINNSYLYNISYQIFDEIEDLWLNTSCIYAFSSYEIDGDDYTICGNYSKPYKIWDNQTYYDWKVWDVDYNHIEYSYGGMSDWYITPNQPIISGNTYKCKIHLKQQYIQLGENGGKYWFAFKPSSETLSQAVGSGHLYYLDPWISGNWSYRKLINVSNNLEDYQTNITLYNQTGYTYNLSGNLSQGDFSDIRFASLNGTLIPYWIKNYTENVSCNVWINNTYNVSNNDMYIYYGNSSAVDASDGDTCFDFFDDCETGSIGDKWTVQDTGSCVSSYSDTVSYSGSYSIKQYDPDSNNCIIKGYSQNTDAVRVGYQYYYYEGSSEDSAYHYESGDASYLTVIVEGDGSIRYYTGSSWIEVGGDGGADMNTQDWEQIQFNVYDDGTTTEYAHMLVNGVDLGNVCRQENNPTFYNRTQFQTSTTETMTVCADDIYVAKWVVGGTGEPVFSFDSQETSGSCPTSEVDTIIPYWQDEVSTVLINTTVTGSTPDLVALWYRWSTDNSSWDGGNTSWVNDSVDNNDDNYSPSSIGNETNFSYCQATNADGSVMVIQENNTGGGGDNETLYVNSNESGVAGAFDYYGSPPYLDAIDYSTNYISSNLQTETSAWFHFPDTTFTGTIYTNLSLYTRCTTAGLDDYYDVYVDYTGSGSGSVAGSITPTADWAWHTINLGSHTPEELNLTRVYFDHQKGGSKADTIESDCMKLDLNITNSGDNYEIDREYQFTNQVYDRDVENLCIKTTDRTGTEDLYVDYWDGDSWEDIGTLHTVGWNNFTAVGLTSSTYSIRLVGATETGDSVQGDWDIDCIYLNCYNSSGGSLGYNWSLWGNNNSGDIDSFTFDCPNGTAYYQFYSITNLSGCADEIPPSYDTPDSICHVNFSGYDYVFPFCALYFNGTDNIYSDAYDDGILLNNTFPYDTPVAHTENTLTSIYCGAYIAANFNDTMLNGETEGFAIDKIYSHLWVGYNDTLWATTDDYWEEYGCNLTYDYANPDPEYTTVDGGDQITSIYNDLPNVYFNLSTPFTWDVNENEINWDNVSHMYQNFTIHAKSGGVWLICNRSMMSFIIINPPNATTMNSSYNDVDGDGVSTWNEMYNPSYYTDPFTADTDGDGISDYWEVLAGSDPNDYTETFNVSWNIVNNWNGSIYNSSSWYLWESWNGSIYNQSVWNTKLVWNGSIYNQSVWNTKLVWNGSIYNSSNWIIENNWNGSIYNSTPANLVESWNGSIFNSSNWYLISSWNGSIFNQSVWMDVVSWNGSIYNQSSWYINLVWNGSIYNSTPANLVESWNGSIFNSSNWYLISSWNGSIFNNTIWNTEITWNGSIFNQSQWYLLEFWNGSIYNTTNWVTEISWNGSIFNQSIWMNINNWNGSIYNSSTGFSIINNWNGSIYNITSWNTIHNWNGSIFNQSVWMDVVSWNGSIYNQSVWNTKLVWNGSIFNSTSWNIISNYNGSIFNQSQWYQINNWNGSIYNSSVFEWYTFYTYNGTIYNSTSWDIISNWNGSIFNQSLWYLINNWNGTIYNSSNWYTEIVWNGSIFNSSSANIINNWNGSIYNTTSWVTETSWNGSIFNQSVWMDVVSWNGSIYNQSIWHIWNNYNGSIWNSSDEWITEITWNGTIFNSTSWITVNNWNGTIFNSSDEWITAIIWNGTIFNSTPANIINNWNGSIYNVSVYYILISNIYPVNNSYDNPLQPYLVATINSSEGRNMNISYYYGLTQGSENILLDQNNNVDNDTYTSLLYAAITHATPYYWRIYANDGIHHTNETFSFTTEGNITIVNGGSSNIGIVGIAGVLGLVGFIFVIVGVRHKKKKQDSYDDIFDEFGY